MSAKAATTAFDANGNMTTDEVGRRFRYDAWNRLISGDSPNIGFAYGALNRRIQEIRPTETRDLFYSTDLYVEGGVVGGGSWSLRRGREFVLHFAVYAQGRAEWQIGRWTVSHRLEYRYGTSIPL